MSERMSPFVKEAWSRRLNITNAKKWREGTEAGLFCDWDGCVYKNKLAIIFDGKAFGRPVKNRILLLQLYKCHREMIVKTFLLALIEKILRGKGRCHYFGEAMRCTIFITNQSQAIEG
jgi:hypothetical protein